MLGETLRLAILSIGRNLLRSFLTVLGVVIGVAAVIAMVTVGQGSQARVTADIESLGTNVAFLQSGNRVGPPGTGDAARPFQMPDAEAIAALPSVETAMPVVNAPRTAIAGGQNLFTTVSGANTGFLQSGNYDIVLGRAFTEPEERGGALVCIIGETVRLTLFGDTDPLGEQIRLGNVTCRVIGLFAPKGSSSFGEDQDNAVLMPVRTVLRRLLGTTEFTAIMVGFRAGVSTASGIAEVTDLMRDRRRIAIGQEDDFSITDMREIADMLSGITGVLTGLLSSVAAVSLLVGGIGIMNIMLVSVTERTREIGIRLAVGATGRQVLMQFLVEAVVLSGLGGAIGIALGLGLAWAAAGLMGIPFSPDPVVVALAFGFSALVGVVFGYFPARRAARMDPIEALRHQ